METDWQDSRKLTPEGQFSLDTNYYVKQLEEEVTAQHRETRMQRAAFAQLQDMYNARVDTIILLESEVEKVRHEIGEHEKLAVDQQMKIDEIDVFAKRIGFSSFSSFVEEFKKMPGVPMSRGACETDESRLSDHMGIKLPVSHDLQQPTDEVDYDDAD
jgi:AraC-like DNA-binding protein